MIDTIGVLLKESDHYEVCKRDRGETLNNIPITYLWFHSMNMCLLADDWLVIVD